MRSLLTWLTLLHVLHLPIPFPDLDGECRGTPIESLCDVNAWQVLLIGVEPSDDLDRGPLRTSDKTPIPTSNPSPWGDVAIHARTADEATSSIIVLFCDGFELPLLRDELVPIGDHEEAIFAGGPTTGPLSQGGLSRLCRWQV